MLWGLYILNLVGKYTRDPREAINLARIASTKEKVDKYVELFYYFEYLDYKLETAVP